MQLSSLTGVYLVQHYFCNGIVKETSLAKKVTWQFRPLSPSPEDDIIVRYTV